MKAKQKHQKRQDRRPTEQPAPNKATTAPQPEPACQPLLPQPKLFIALMLAFAVWVGVLLTLYFKTVYPMRHATGAPATSPW